VGKGVREMYLGVRRRTFRISCKVARIELGSELEGRGATGAYTLK